MDLSLARRRIDLDLYLKRSFGKASFRPLQRDVITAAVEGYDVFLQASTSFGKSLCFQLPAVTTHGVTVVVCPLVSLMIDQVNALKTLGVPVAMINSNTPFEERRLIFADLLSGHPRSRLLYVTPELCQTDTFRRHLKTIHRQRELMRVAIDEAHCVSEWGHDFRPAYRDLAWFRTHLTDPPVPISALTATATPQVREDIIKILGLNSSKLKLFTTPSTRPNIHYEIRFMEHFAPDPNDPETFQINDFLCWLHSVQARRKARLDAAGPAEQCPISGIVYVSTRIASTRLAESLCRRDSRIRAVAYHAGLSNADRERVQNEWIAPRKQQRSTDKNKDSAPLHFYIIVATAAFGMGIDNLEVRFVVHWSPPRTFEGFVQESGRAGRDGRAAVSIIYYNPQERERILEWLRRDIESLNNGTGGKTTGLQNRKKVDRLRNLYARKQSFEKVVRYCETTTKCRHKMIRDFFGDSNLENPGSQVPVKAEDGADIKVEDVDGGGDVSGVATLTSPCDWACDFCKEGPKALANRKQKLAPETGLALFTEYSSSWLEDMFRSINRMFPADQIFPAQHRFG
ncbi:P-loop containing nucleoside triphosphate hydrolase protein [Aspergillus heterothallicus]